MPNRDDRDRRVAQGSQPVASGPRPAGTRFKQPAATSRGASPSSVRRASQQPQSARGTRYKTSSYRDAASGSRRVRVQKKTSHVPAVLGALIAIAIVAVAAVVFVPMLGGLLGGNANEKVEAGQQVQVTIPEGSSGDDIASILSQAHVIDNPKAYYAAVSKLGADMSLKPGDYQFTTGQNPEDVVHQLMEGPNVEGLKLTIQEGLTVAQTASRVQEVYGISTEEFLAQAKASNYVADYPFLEGAYNDSLEGYLYPKTYSFTKTPTVDELIRAMLSQFQTETSQLDLTAAPHGLTALQVVSMASLIERETAIEEERPLVASVIYNRLDADMPLQIDAAIVYARGGGSDIVTYDDLKIDSPYNVYTNKGLVPGPICSPSVSSIKAVLQPANTDYLYYVASPTGDGTHRFSSSYEQFEQDRQEYSESLS